MLHHHLHQVGMHLGPWLWLGLGLRLLLWAAVLVLGVLLLRALMRRGQPVAVVAVDPALERLRGRLASGEIDSAEYERLRVTLSKP